MWCGIISATFLPEFSIIPLPVYLLFHSASQTHVNITVYFLSRVTEHCLGASHKYANGIHHKFESTAAAQQSVNLFLLCSFFQCLKVVIPNLYHSLQALDSLLLPSSLSVDNCQKKKKNWLQPRTLSIARFICNVSILPTFTPVIKYCQCCFFSKAVSSFSKFKCRSPYVFQSYQSYFLFLFINLSRPLQSLFPLLFGIYTQNAPKL